MFTGQTTLPFSGYVFLLITGIMLKAGLEGWGRENWNRAIRYDPRGLMEILLFSSLYTFFLGPILTVPLVLLACLLLSDLVLADLMLLVGPQLGPLADSIFVILLSDQPLSSASAVLSGQSKMDAGEAAQALNSIFPNAMIPTFPHSIPLAIAIPVSRFVLIAILPFLVGLLFNFLNGLFFHKLFGRSENSSEDQGENPSKDLLTDNDTQSKSEQEDLED